MDTDENRILGLSCNAETGGKIEDLFSPLVVDVSVVKKDVLGARIHYVDSIL